MTENPALRALDDFWQALVETGVRHVCLSPGSRSAPLAISAARRSDITLWSLLDERSAGFFALGLARAAGQPVVLVCTSGTAVGNYLPAVIEAHHSCVPLIVVSADRPPELHGVGSNQTIDQQKLFGTFVKLFAEMPVPEPEDWIGRHAAATARRLVHQATASPMGPVHLNWPFREPLIPPPPSANAAHGQADNGEGGVYTAVRTPHPRAVERLVKLLRQAHRGLIVCGPMAGLPDTSPFAAAVARVAAHLGFPVLADPLSGVRCGAHALDVVIDRYEWLLRDEAWMRLVCPDVVIRFGAPPTSKRLGQFLERLAGVPQVYIGDRWLDPYFTLTDFVDADPVLMCEILRSQTERGEARAWLERWQLANQAAADAVEQTLCSAGESAADGLWIEGRVFRELGRWLPEGADLFAGNSMPVRDLDAFLAKRPARLQVWANRGASGIDGVVSTACGVSAARQSVETGAGRRAPVVLVIGDISFYHDLGGLLAVGRHRLDLCVVLVHNDGGGIFSFLPQAAYPDTFAHFRTQHGLDFEPAVRMYGGSFRRVQAWAEFRAAVEDGLAVGGLSVVELRTDADANVRGYRRIAAAVSKALADVCAEVGG
ncbi:MAG: 2-succinyl-5-enolpyruvyl-6-hydroxy-3-cyclohexene-1-carboxylic-acid synthase [Alicyclobacillaceae bacterium]|nr:2-succinyl-5-enolpyruvyl-6-hydroxy-3-cyclohexene-1-carboxylic-acid synthase [Alicyclobacillaceae bacterium]